ncbi:MAG: biotin/lipoyl-containing protein, partial [Chitinophagaceae bacterium]
MATVDLIMPKMGESIMEATILKWHKVPGDHIEMDESLLDIATDKVDSEVPSTTAGIVDALLFSVNDVVPVGAVIARIRTGSMNGGAEGQGTVAPGKTEDLATPGYQLPVQPTADRQPTQQPPVTAEDRNTASGVEPAVTASGVRFYSPLVLNIAGQEGVSMSELENMKGTGNEGRVTKRDILQFVSDKKAGKSPASGVILSKVPDAVPTSTSNQLQTTADNQLAASSYTGNVEIIEMDRMRRLIADHMVR